MGDGVRARQPDAQITEDGFATLYSVDLVDFWLKQFLAAHTKIISTRLQLETATNKLLFTRRRWLALGMDL